MQHQILGTTLQTLEMILQPGEMVYSQTHQLAWMSDGITLDTNTGGGFFQGLARAAAGGSFFVTHFTANAPALLAFCPRFPGTMVARQLGPGESLVCRKESFLCAQSSVQLSIFFRQQIGGGFFGGEGFILQQVTGPGWVFLDLSGEVVEKDLRPGERLQVHVGHVAVQDPTVQFGLTRIGGVRNIIFGGEGLFLAALTGPGKVLLQSMPIINLAEEIFKYAPGGNSGSYNNNNNNSGGLGNVLGNLLSGN